jgi:hypothetical protein
VAYILDYNFAQLVGREFTGYVSRMGRGCEEALQRLQPVAMAGGLPMFDAAMLPPMSTESYDPHADAPPGGWGGMMDPVDMADIDGFFAN